MNRLAMIAAPRPSETPIAAGRLRPARDLAGVAAGASVVLADVAVLGEPVERVLGMTAYRPDRHLGLFTLVPRDLHQLAAALLGELREHDPDDRAVVGRIDAEVAVADRPLDRRELRRVV